MPLSWDLVIPPGIGILTPPTVSSWEPLQPDAATAMQSRQAASRSHLLISALIICLFTGSYISVLTRSIQNSAEQETCDGWLRKIVSQPGPKGLNYEAGEEAQVGAYFGALRAQRSRRVFFSRLLRKWNRVDWASPRNT